MGQKEKPKLTPLPHLRLWLCLDLFVFWDFTKFMSLVGLMETSCCKIDFRIVLVHVAQNVVHTQKRRCAKTSIRFLLEKCSNANFEKRSDIAVLIFVIPFLHLLLQLPRASLPYKNRLIILYHDKGWSIPGGSYTGP